MVSMFRGFIRATAGVAPTAVSRLSSTLAANTGRPTAAEVSRVLFSRDGPVSHYVVVNADEQGYYVETCVHHPLSISRDKAYYDSMESADRAADLAFAAFKKPLGPPPSIDD